MTEEQKNMALPASILIAAVLISGTLLYTRGSFGGSVAKTPKETPIKLDLNADDHVLGDPNAKLTIFEYSDFQCPFCRRFFSTSYKDIKSNYIDTGKAKLVYRHLPLDFHPAAKPAAIAAECASAQGKFWEMHDKIFNEQIKLNPGEIEDPTQLKTIEFTDKDLRKWAGQIGLDMNAYDVCVKDEKNSARVDRDLESGQAIGINGTPTFVIGGVRVVGAQPFESEDPRETPFKPIIEKALKK